MILKVSEFHEMNDYLWPTKFDSVQTKVQVNVCAKFEDIPSKHSTNKNVIPKSGGDGWVTVGRLLVTRRHKKK